MTDDQYFLASVYADDAASPAERAQAEADVEVMAEVARIRELQAALADVEPAPGAVRAAALATAMAEFARAPAAGAPAPAHVPTTLADRRRPAQRWSRLLNLTAAAAAIVVVAVGIAAVVGGNRSDDGDDSAGAPEVSLLNTAEDAELRVAADDATDATDATNAADAAGASDEASSSYSASEPADALELPAAAPEPAATEAPAGTATILSAESAVIETAAELAAVGDALRAAYTDDEMSGAVATDCTPEAAVSAPDADDSAESQALRAELPESVEQVALLDTRDYRTPEGVVAVFVAVDLESGQTYAIDAARCVLVGFGTAP